MSRRRKLPLHIVAPDPDAQPFDERDVLASDDHAHFYITLATELWRLLGDDAKARAIEAVIDRAHGRTTPTLDTADIRELLALVTPLEAAIRRELTDDKLLITMEQVAELRAKSKHLDLDESRGADARHAVSEAVADIANLESFLQEALDRGGHIVFD